MMRLQSIWIISNGWEGVAFFFFFFFLVFPWRDGWMDGLYGKWGW